MNVLRYSVTNPSRVGPWTKEWPKWLTCSPPIKQVPGSIPGEGTSSNCHIGSQTKLQERQHGGNKLISVILKSLTICQRLYYYDGFPSCSKLLVTSVTCISLWCLPLNQHVSNWLWTLVQKWLFYYFLLVDSTQNKIRSVCNISRSLPTKRHGNTFLIMLVLMKFTCH
jgi:hypothetical protein